MAVPPDNVVHIDGDDGGAQLQPAGLQPFPEVREEFTGLADDTFLRALKRLKDLREFLQQAAVVSSPDALHASQLGGLNQLRRHRSAPIKGRPATYLEWSQVEERSQIIWAALTEPQRRKFLSTQTPTWLTYMMVSFFAIALFALVFAYLVKSGDLDVKGHLLVPFVIWIVALGAIGSASFIGMNAISVQDDATFDLSSGKLIWLRLILGSLFGAVLTLPFGFSSFSLFLEDLLKAKPLEDPEKALQQTAFLLLPFILGFSTSVVILILNRMIDGVQTFFGKPPTKP